MKKQRLDELQTIAKVSQARGNPALKRARLNRWADLLMRTPDRPLKAISMIELHDAAHQLRLRADNTPMALAYADPVFRAEGLKGDTLGDAQTFFGMSRRDTHNLLCTCRYGSGMSGRLVAQRLARLASPSLLKRTLASLFG